MQGDLYDHATIIIDSAQTLLGERYGTLTSRQTEAIKTIIANAEKLLHMYAEFTAMPLEDVPSMMRHELGNQLTPIRGYSDLLIMGVMGTLNLEQQAHVEAIYDTTTVLREMINEIVAKARTVAQSAGKYEPDSTEDAASSDLELTA